MALPSLLLPLAAGWLTARGLLNFRPVWALHFTCAGLAVALGAGWASLLQLLLLWTGLAQPVTALGADVLVCAGAFLLFRKNVALETGEDRPACPWNWIGWVALVLTAGLCLAGFAAGWEYNPHGYWDAFSIWNLRAKWMATPEAWRYAIEATAPVANFGVAHPGYPLLLSGFVGHIWMAGGSFDPVWPMVVSVLFTLAVPALLAGLLAAGRSTLVGLTAAAVALSADIFVLQGPRLYSDIPLALYLLGAVGLMAVSWQRGWHAGALALAGACTGLACWTKNEGIPFAVAMGGLLAWAARRQALPFAGGALPGVAVMAAFRLALAPPDREVQLPSTLAGVLEKLSEPARWWVPIAGYAQKEWLIPLVCVAVAAWTLRVNRQEGLARARWLALPLVVLLMAGYAAFLLTTSDQKWHVNTAASRLIAQLWPATLFVAMWAMGRPEDFAETVPVKSGKRAR